MTYVQCGRHYSENFKIFQLLFCSPKDDIMESAMQKVQAQGRGTKTINRRKEMTDKKVHMIRKKFCIWLSPTVNQPVKGGSESRVLGRTYQDSI